MSSKLGFCAVLMLLVSGCSLHPLDLSGNQWERMTPEQQAQAYQEQARLDETVRARREQRKQLQTSSKEYNQEQKRRLRQAVPGDVLQCVLNDVQIKTGKNHWRAAHPAGAELLQGESRKLILKRSDHISYPYRALRILFEQGSVQACDRSGSHCSVLSATAKELQRGKQVYVDVSTVRARLKCQYPPQFWHPG